MCEIQWLILKTSSMQKYISCRPDLIGKSSSIQEILFGVLPLYYEYSFYTSVEFRIVPLYLIQYLRSFYIADFLPEIV